MATQAEVRDLIAKIRATGNFKVAKNGTKHYKVLKSNGAVVVDADGPLIISATPSEHRFREMTVQRLIRNGVFKTDPYKETRGTKNDPDANGNGASGGKKKRGGSPFADPERAAAINEAKVAAIKAKSERLREETAVLRGRLEPIVARLGGWALRGGTTGISTNEFGEVVFHWAKSRARVELPRRTVQGLPITATQVASPVQHLKTPGATIGEKWLPLFQVFVDELERNTGTPVDREKAAQRYRELYREAKGISEGPKTPAAGAPIPVPAREVAGAAEGGADGTAGETLRIGPAYDQIGAPSLALKAMWLMAKSGEPQEDAMEVAVEIAELELNNPNRRRRG